MRLPYWVPITELTNESTYGLRDGVVLSDNSTVFSIAGAFEDPFLVCFDQEGNILWIVKTNDLGLVENAHITDSSIQKIDPRLITLELH
jgi:hypothetical protein